MLMQSTKLSGCSEWRKIIPDNYEGLLFWLPALPGVYVMRYDQAFGRFQGVSDILYVGKTDNKNGLRERIRQHLEPGPTQWTCQRVNAFLNKYGLEGEIELAFFLPGEGKTRKVEKALLDKYYEDHGELPPLNRSN